YVAAGKVIDNGKRIAAHLLEASVQDIEFADGTFRVAGTDKSLQLKEVAGASFQPGRVPAGTELGLYENATYLAEKDTYPNGCHIAEGEIDPDTGHVEISHYTGGDDVC